MTQEGINRRSIQRLKVMGESSRLTLLVRFKDSDDLGEIVINEQDFNSEVHELVE